MPTSSQALILLSTEGQLPRYNALQNRKFPVSSIPYPMHSLDINAVAKDFEDSLSDFDPPYYDRKRHTRVQLESISESLPELLSIRGYRGSLSYDPETKVIKWQVNTDLPRDKTYPKLAFRGGQLYNLENDNPTAIGSEKFPPINVDRPIRLPNIDVNNPEALAQKTEELRQYFSLPKIFKATVDNDTYKRLCNLGFRRPSYENGNKEKTKHKPESDERHVEFIKIPTQAWEADGTEDKDFRIEDLNLNPNNAHVTKIKYTNSRHQFPYLSRNEHFKDFFAENVTSGNKQNHNISENVPADNSTNHLPEDRLKDSIKKRRKLKLSEATLFPDADMYIARSSKRGDQVESDSEKENIRQPMSLLDDVKEMSNYNKWKKAKITSIRLRKELPPSQPLAVCFTLPDNVKPHKDVKALVESQIGTPVTKLQFDPVAVHAIDRDAKSRWIATLSDSESRDLLAECGLIVNGERIEVRRYDDVTHDEVQAYKIFELIQKGRMQNEANGNKQKRRKSRVK